MTVNYHIVHNDKNGKAFAVGDFSDRDQAVEFFFERVDRREKGEVVIFEIQDSTVTKK